MAPPLKASTGQTLDGRFHLLEEIGRGGMSVVFKASDLANAGEVVAVKVPRPEFGSGLGNWSMFQHEAEIGARLRHPSIVRFVPMAAGTRYVVTEYLDGPTLASRTGKDRRLPEAEALKLVSLVCDAVDYMHREGVVHYDLKPGNVVLCADGSLRVLDLGMAHEVIRGRYTLSAAAPPFATSGYVAPEQIRRRRGRPSVDIYALGAMLYEMVTGRLPFDDGDPFVVASARQIGDPRAPRAVCGDVSVEVEEIILRAMRRDPAERYRTAAELKADLDDPSRVRVSGLAARLVPVTRWRKGLRWARFITLTTVTPLGLLVVLFRVLWWWLDRRR